MNVFEDLVDELEEEHLLETTVFEEPAQKNVSKQNDLKKQNETELELPEVVGLERNGAVNDEEIIETEKFLKQLESENKGSVRNEDEILEIDSPVLNPPNTESFNEPVAHKPKKKLTEFEYFRKRAMEEVSSLQMVDNIFSSVEREQMKIVPQPFDDLPVKQVLHSFLQLPGDVSLNEHAEAEFELRKGTENWYSSLAERDKKISVANLRYCCENTRPPLSPPALLALAKFYRNAPFSEDVRNKFDLIITRLFSSDVEGSKRELVFSHEELTDHLTELYAEWESVAFYPTDDKDEDLLVAVLKLEDFITEANRAESFDDLIQTEFFNRVRAFKRSTCENFYAPQVAAMSIICNVKIGNRYVDLLQFEREKTFEEDIEEKYGFIFDQSISDATNKSLQLAELLKQRKQNTKVFDLEDIERHQTGKAKVQKSKPKSSKSKSLGLQTILGVNKTLLALTILSVAISIGIYLWVEVFTTPRQPAENVKQLNLENTEFKEYIETARLNNEIFYGVTTPAWDILQPDKKEEVLQKLIADGTKKGYKKVMLLGKNGLNTGSASQNKIEVK